MSIIAWIILGAVAGTLASIVLPSRGGLIASIIIGILGAFVGGYLFEYFGEAGVTGLNLYSIFVATVGSIVCLWVASLIRG